MDLYSSFEERLLSPKLSLSRFVLQKSKKATSDDELDAHGFEQSDTPSRDRPGRAKKEVKYFAESDDDDNEQYGMFD